MFVARDMYIHDRGRLVVKLFSLFKVADGMGQEYNQGELLRWLAESLMYPTNFLPDDRLRWSPIDAHTANLAFAYQELSLHFTVTFNDLGEITEMETRRYMSKNRLETWIIRAANYQEKNHVLIPTEFNVLWRLPEGDFSYAQFNILDVAYYIPEKY